MAANPPVSGETPGRTGGGSAPPPNYPPPGNYPPPPNYPPPDYPPPDYPPPGSYQPPGYPPPASYPPPAGNYPGYGYPQQGTPPPGYYPPQGGYPYPQGPANGGAATYASWGVRLGAYLIDFVIVWVVGVVANLPLKSSHVWQYTIHITTHTNGVKVYHATGLSLLLFIVISVLYGTLFCGSSLGRTPGMMAVGLHSVLAATGGPTGYGRSFVRAILQWVFFAMVVFGWVIDMLWPLWDSKRQTLHTKIAGTVVIRK